MSATTEIYATRTNSWKLISSRFQISVGYFARILQGLLALGLDAIVSFPS